MTAAVPAAALAAGVVWGGLGGAGLWLLSSCIPRWRAPRLSARIAPYVPAAAGGIVRAPRGRSTVRDRSAELGRRLAQWRGGATALERRLALAGRRLEPGRFRERQLWVGLAGLAGGSALALAAAFAGYASSALLTLPWACALAAVLAGELRLRAAARAAQVRICDEVPTVLEFLALCVSAGEGLRDALRRVADVGSGVLPERIRRMLVDVGTGTTLADGLAALGRDVDVPALARATDHLVAALERGAPLADVLHAQAADARAEAARGLLARAGKQDVAMLVPLVLLILPLSVVMAVFPGIRLLSVGL